MKLSGQRSSPHQPQGLSPHPKDKGSPLLAWARGNSNAVLSWEFSEANDNTAKRNALARDNTDGPAGDRTGRFPIYSESGRIWEYLGSVPAESTGNKEERAELELRVRTHGPTSSHLYHTHTHTHTHARAHVHPLTCTTHTRSSSHLWRAVAADRRGAGIGA